MDGGTHTTTTGAGYSSKAADLWDIESPIFNARAVTEVVKLITSEMLRHDFPNAKIDGGRVLMVDDTTVEALHYAVARLEEATGEAASVFNQIIEEQKARKLAASMGLKVEQ